MAATNNVVILAGGRGSRMGEQTDLIPKPMVRIGGKPIIEHIMYNFYRHLGDCNFIILGGYRYDILRDYFLHSNHDKVEVLDTGEETQTGGRLQYVSWLDTPFHLCYGDGLTDFNLSHLRLNDESIVNMLTVHPTGRFGEVKFNHNKRVTSFSEKPVDNRWINGGYFRVHPGIFDYIAGDDDILETHVFSRIMMENGLYSTPYEGYWHCMDTPKDWKELDTEYRLGEAKWLM